MVRCLGTPVVRTDAASIWITGQTWWQIPKVSKVTFTGKMRRDWGVCGKDVILSLCGFFKNDEVRDIYQDGERNSQVCFWPAQVEEREQAY